MDSFSQPQPLPSVSLPDVREQVRQLEEQHRTNGIALSGRVLHVCHYLPLVATYNIDSGEAPISPPATPPVNPTVIDSAKEALSAVLGTGSSTAPQHGPKDKWTLEPRQGHSAMTSGVVSLSSTHEQVIIGWPGDIVSGTGEAMPSGSIAEEDKKALHQAIADYHKEPIEMDANDSSAAPDASDSKPAQKISYVPVLMDDDIAHGHYEGYCKQTLWPLFHYLLWQDAATEYASADQFWPAYEAANKRFAEVVLSVWQPGDLVWVHDYHLLLVPKQLRQLEADAKKDGGLSDDGACVGLFVHTPFPSSEVFRCLPRRKEILDGMLGANLVCFQTYSYSRHFTSSCIRVCGYEISPGRGIDVAGHVTTIMHCPVGVDAGRVARDTMRPGIQPKLEALKGLYEGKKIIVGRDKLDVVKGVHQKLRAFEKLLHDYPEWIGNVVLIQVTSPTALSPDTAKLERQVSELVAHINGEYGSLDFVPVHHYHQTINKDEFYALLGIADLAVITPFRDGMNTTSMEFVIAQEKTKQSPLMLSEFMGISTNMSDALLINPWNLGDVAAEMNHGLLMSDAEKQRRHQALYKVVSTHTSHTWAALLVKMLLAQMGAHGLAKRTPVLPQEKMMRMYTKAPKRLFLFDYDGTLAPIVKVPSAATPSEKTLEALTKLSEDPKNVVYIISGRDGAFLEQHLGHIKKLGMSAEHGGFVRGPGEPEWRNFTETLDMSWMNDVREIFEYYTERTTGSHIELKKSSITWHYRSSDPEWGQFQCRQCQDLLENNLAHKRPIEVLVGKKNLEVRPIAVNKGEIVKRILYQNPDAEFVFCAGDDKTDEDMFRALLFPVNETKFAMDAPLSVTLLEKDPSKFGRIDLALTHDGLYTTAVGHRSKRTLASWHVTSPEEIVDSMLQLVGGSSAAHL